MVYDAARERVLMFGGFEPNLNYLFPYMMEWDGATWIERTEQTISQRPAARFGAAMAYDSTREEVMLFGGQGQYANYDPFDADKMATDTWRWDGDKWSRLTPSVRPGGRYFHAMAYDAARGKIVLFGGIVTGRGYANDTWEWDGTNWLQRTPAHQPPGRYGHAMAYDAARGKVVLFGGRGGAEYNDTWEWDGSDWTQLSPAISPPGLIGHAMAYDSLRERVVLFGGAVGSDGYSSRDVSTTWEWDGTNWAQRTTVTSPEPRTGHAMAFDAVRGQTVMFGGVGNDKHDTWEYGDSALTSQAVDLSVTATGPASAQFGQTITHIITARSGAPVSTLVNLSISLPAAARFDALNAPECWTIEAPAIGATGTIKASRQLAVTNDQVFTVTLKIPDDAPYGPLTTTAKIAGTAPDPDVADRRARAISTIFEPKSLVVNTISDISADDGVTTLREAIDYAKTRPGTSTVTFDPAVFATSQTIFLNGAPLEPGSAGRTLIIDGPAEAPVTIDNARRHRLFTISGGSVILNSLTLTNGAVEHVVFDNGTYSVLDGGAIENRGSLALNRCTLRSNSGQEGGAIWSAGPLTVTECTFSRNSAGYGGAIYCGGTVNIYRSTFDNNSAAISGSGQTTNSGGAIFNNGGTLRIENSTFVGNRSTWAGAIFHNSGTLNAVNNTIVGNTASERGGGIRAGNGARFSGNAIALNISPQGPDVSASSITSLGYNVLGAADGSTGWLSTDKTGTVAAALDLKFDLDSAGKPILEDNGGPTATVALLAGSPAIDVMPFGTPATDQRGKARSAPAAGNAADAGAFEVSNTAPTTSGIEDVTVRFNAPDTVINLFDAFADAQDADQALVFTVQNNTNPSQFGAVRVSDAGADPATLTLEYPGTSAGISSITVRATDTAGAFAEATFKVTVEQPVFLFVTDAMVVESSGSALEVVFPVQVVNANGRAVTVDYTTEDGTATAPADYATTTGTLTFPPYATLATIKVPVVADDVAEGVETFKLKLSNATNVYEAQTEATGSIYDDETAGNLVVNLTTDTVDRWDGKLSLREAVAYAMQRTGTPRITFAPNVVESGPIGLTQGELTIDHDVIIEGPAEGTVKIVRTSLTPSRFFNITDGTVRFSNLQLGDSQYVPRSGQSGEGGAIHVSGGNLTVVDCLLTGNRATSNGGAIYFAGTNLTVTGSTFSANNAQEGGAIYLASGNANFTSGTWSENEATVDGGAVFQKIDQTGAKLGFTNCNFDSNKAPNGYGGAMSLRIGFARVYETHALQIKGCSFVENTAFSGAGLRVDGYATLIADSTFRQNVATGTSQNVSMGGALIYFSYSNLTMKRCLVTGNEAAQGGGLMLSGDDITLNDCFIESNKASLGAGISNQGRTAATNCTLAWNNATESGGGVYNHNIWPMTFTNCTIANNRATHAGAGLFGVLNSTQSFDHCTVAGNSAAKGGGFFVAGLSSSTSIADSIVAGNEAPEDPDIFYGSMTSQGYNVIGVYPHASTGQTTDRFGTAATPLDPKLEFVFDPVRSRYNVDLKDNGGLTPTAALTSGSPAIDLVPFGSTTTDQRGKARTAPAAGAAADAGAYEVQAPVLDLNGNVSGNYETTFTEGSSAISVVDTARLQVMAGEKSDITGATILLKGIVVRADEKLFFTLGNSGLALTESEEDSNVRRYTLSGTASPAVYQQVLRTICYQNTVRHPDETDRTLEATVTDGVATSTMQTAIIHVNALDLPPVSHDNHITINEDTSTQIMLTAADGESAGLIYSVVGGPQHGSLSGTAPHLTYIPAANYYGPDSFTFKASDGTLESNLATVSIEVTPLNDAPVAQDQSVGTNEDTQLAITLTGSDIDNASLSYNIVAQPQHGTLTGTGADWTYTPVTDYHGPDAFTFEANDGLLDSNVATVSITVGGNNDAPIAVDDTSTVDEDTPLDIAVLANDTDVDNNNLQVVRAAATAAAHGTVTINANGTLHYVPESNFHGSATFAYTASDGSLESSASVTVTVRPVNDAPIAVADSYAVNTASLSIAAPGVLGNDSDVDSRTLSTTTATKPDHGSVTMNTDGSFTYVPLSGYSGLDSFTYTVSDGSLSANGTVTLNVAAVVPEPTPTTPPDRLAPSVAFTSPRNGSRSTGFPAIAGTAHDRADSRGPAGSDIVNLLLTLRRAVDGRYWNGNTWVTPPTNLTAVLGGAPTARTFAYNGVLPSGTDLLTGVYYLSAIAFDGAGNRGQQTVSFRVLDVTAPIVTITAPHNGETLSHLSQLNGTLSEEATGSGPTRVILVVRRSSDGAYWNGVRWMQGQSALRTTLRGSGNRLLWTAATALPAAPSTGYDVYFISALGYDRSGKRGVATIAVTMTNADTRVATASAPVSRVALSTAAGHAAGSTIRLVFDGRLNSASLVMGNFAVVVAGVSVVVESVHYDAATSTVALKLAEGGLNTGDSAQVMWHSLLDLQSALVQGKTEMTVR